MGKQKHKEVKDQVEGSDEEIESINIDASSWEVSLPYSISRAASKVDSYDCGYV